jgi:hypothetical protein
MTSISAAPAISPFVAAAPKAAAATSTDPAAAAATTGTPAAAGAAAPTSTATGGDDASDDSSSSSPGQPKKTEDAPAPTKSAKQAMIDQLKKQIEALEKTLTQQQQQLQAVQTRKMDQHAKEQQAMLIQGQISGTMTQIQSLQSSLMELLSGSVNTTA